MSDRTMRVQGVGRARAEPELATISFHVQGVHEDYTSAVNGLNQKVAQLRAKLANAGIQASNLKTVDFGVESNFNRKETYRDFFGFRAKHDLELELPFSMDLLNRVLGTIAAGAADARLSISFGVRDPDDLRRQSLRAAVKAARSNAAALAEAADVKLGKIVDIEYGWAEVRFRRHEIASVASVSDSVPSPDVTPREVTSTESVTVVWEIE